MEAARRTLTVPEVAERLHVGIRTVTAWIRAGELRGVLISKSRRSRKPRFVVDPLDLAAFEASRSPVKKAAPAPRRRPVDYIEFH